MAQVTVCDHCGGTIDESDPGETFARMMVQSSAGGSAQCDYHNSAEKPCFAAAYDAVKAASNAPGNFPDIATEGQATAAEVSSAE